MTSAWADDPQVERELRRGVIDIIPERDFFDALASGRSLRLKLGLDPSKPDLHIGHGVLLRKLRLLQEMGHQVVLIVGDWTARIGDPSGQSVMRSMLTAEEVRANAETYMRQFFYVVDKAKTEVRWQSEWFDKFTLADTVRLAARFTVAQMLQREDFRQRYEAQKPLGVHELFYPLLQAYDSIAIQSDVEFGGTDQLFNLLVGRELQEHMGQRPQICITMRLLVGTDGSQKMSKSLGNTIDFEDPPAEQYGKVMSIPDSALVSYLELATDIGDEEIAYMRKQIEEGSGATRMEIKKRLAREIVGQFHGETSAREAEAEWSRVFQEREFGGASMPEVRIDELRAADEEKVPIDSLPEVDQQFVSGASPSDVAETLKELRELGKSIKGATFLVEFGFAPSLAEARRLIKQGALRKNDETVTSLFFRVKPGDVLRIGKHRFLRIVDADREAKTS